MIFYVYICYIYVLIYEIYNMPELRIVYNYIIVYCSICMAVDMAKLIAI